ncbi:MAG: hypothetical protein ACRD96_21420, partial [Bryobacteraceae bacterium]
VTVRANINYNNRGGKLQAQAIGFAVARIDARRGYRRRRLLASDDVRHSFQLRGANTLFANEQGQVVIGANLDGLASSVLLYENGVPEALAAGGMPGPNGGIVVNFTLRGLNHRGQALFQAGVAGGSTHLLLASRGSLSPVFMDGATFGGIDNLGHRESSLNDNADVVMIADFNWTGNTTRNSGLFRLNASGTVQAIWTNDNPLSGFPPAFSFTNPRIDNNGVTYFYATTGPQNRRVYRADGRSGPEKLIGTGDAFGGSTVAGVGDSAVSAGGEVVVQVNLQDRTNHLVRFAAGKMESTRVNSVNNVGIHDAGGVVFSGDAGRGLGVYRWHNNAVTPVLLANRLAPNEQPYRNLRQVFVNAKGEITVQAETTNNNFIVLQPAAPNPLVVELGQRVDVTAGLPLQQNTVLLRGMRGGPVHLRINGSLFQLDGGQLIPRLLPGDRMPDGNTYSTTNNFIEDAAGNVYFSFNNQTWYRMAPSGVIEVFLRSQTDLSDGSRLNNINQLVVNRFGAAVALVNTSRGNNRLFLFENGRSTLLFDAAANAASPAGGTLSGYLGPIAIDDRGRIFAGLQATNGPGGYFQWEDGRWKPSAMVGFTRLGGRLMGRGQSLEAIGERVIANFQFQPVGTGTVLCELRDGDWAPLVPAGDIMPDGSIQGNPFSGAFDFNSAGEGVFINQRQIVHRAGGTQRLATILGEATEDGDVFQILTDFDIRDDGRIYFTGYDIFGRFLVYV